MEVSGPTVLVVEDDEPAREALQTALFGAGYQVVTAKDGEEAWAVLRAEHPPCFMLLDVLLPKLDGYELMERMREHAWLDRTHVVVLTGTDYDRRLSGCVGFFRKPTPVDRILKSVRDWCGDPHVR